MFLVPHLYRVRHNALLTWDHPQTEAHEWQVEKLHRSRWHSPSRGAPQALGNKPSPVPLNQDGPCDQRCQLMRSRAEYVGHIYMVFSSYPTCTRSGTKALLTWDHPQTEAHWWQVENCVDPVGIPLKGAPQALGNKPSPAPSNRGDRCSLGVAPWDQRF